MAYELHSILTGAVNMTTGEKVMPAYHGDSESFLNNVVFPVYEVIQKVRQSLDMHLHLISIISVSNLVHETLKEAMKNGKGTADHSTWRNYDDLNEFFW